MDEERKVLGRLGQIRSITLAAAKEKRGEIG